MATIKKLNTDYSIITPTGGNINLNVGSLGTVTVTGNLVVLGAQTAIETTNTTLKDNIIVLNDGETGAGVTASQGTAGFIVDRGTSANVTLRWNEGTHTWQITNDGSSYANIATVSSSTLPNLPALTAIVQDPLPTLGGNLNLNSYTIYDSTTTANVQMTISNTVGGGGSGVRVTNTAVANAELATQGAAIKYAIIFG
jgi:hypothetical protein